MSLRMSKHMPKHMSIYMSIPMSVPSAIRIQRCHMCFINLIVVLGISHRALTSHGWPAHITGHP